MDRIRSGSIVLLFLVLLIGGVAVGYRIPRNSYIPTLKVIGDVSVPLHWQQLPGEGKHEHITYQGEKYQAIKLTDIIQAAQPTAPASQVYLVGSDGFTSLLSADRLEKSYITFSNRYAWEAINLDHPINSNAKMLKEIIVVARGAKDSAFTVINRHSELITRTTGQLCADSTIDYPYFEGTASLQKRGETFKSSVYTRRRVFQLRDVAPVPASEHLLVLGKKGGYCLAENGRGYFELKENYIDFLQPDTRGTVEKVSGVMVDPPVTSIMDAYYDARHFLENGNQVLMVIIDGLSYQQYDYALNHGYLPCLQQQARATQATGVYPPENNVSLAALLTGNAPDKNGISQRSDRNLKLPSLFKTAAGLKQSVLLLEADKRCLNLEPPSVTYSDINRNGSADDDLYAATPKMLNLNYDFIVLRFHGVAAKTASYGPLAPPTLAAIQATDHYLSGMVSKWPGVVIITGAQDKAGYTEDISCKTMFVPYLVISR